MFHEATTDEDVYSTACDILDEPCLYPLWLPPQSQQIETLSRLDAAQHAKLLFLLDVNQVIGKKGYEQFKAVFSRAKLRVTLPIEPLCYGFRRLLWFLFYSAHYSIASGGLSLEDFGTRETL